MLNRELEEANSIVRAKRNELQRIEEEVELLMQVGVQIKSCALHRIHQLYPIRRYNHLVYGDLQDIR